MRRLITATLIIISFTLAFTGCTRPSAFQVKTGQPFNLYIGQTAVIESPKFSIKFLRVTADSRCPSDVQCIQAGSVSCLVEITDSSGSKQPSQVTLVQPPGTQTYNGYEIAFDVKPYPVSSRKLTPNDYYMVMTLTFHGNDGPY